MSVRYLTVDEVLFIHERMIREFGGSFGVRDAGALDAALSRPQATFEGQDLYPDVWTKATSLLHSLVLNHPFIDGNKRTGYVAMKTFLHLNGYALAATEEEKYSLVVSAAEGILSLDQIAAWLH